VFFVRSCSTAALRTPAVKVSDQLMYHASLANPYQAAASWLGRRGGACSAAAEQRRLKRRPKPSQGAMRRAGIGASAATDGGSTAGQTCHSTHKIKASLLGRPAVPYNLPPAQQDRGKVAPAASLALVATQVRRAEQTRRVGAHRLLWPLRQQRRPDGTPAASAEPLDALHRSR